jgi:rare lipoprotein A
MAPFASFTNHKAVSSFLFATGAKMALSSLLAVSLLGGAVAFDSSDDSYGDAVVLSFVNTGSSAEGDAELVLLVDTTPTEDLACSMDGQASVLTLAVTPDFEQSTAQPVVAPASQTDALVLGRADSGARHGGITKLLAVLSRDSSPKFSNAYRAMLKFAALIGLPRIQTEATAARSVLVGAISTYNPYRDGIEEGGVQTASGELYDPAGWTAAVQVGLRERVGGVRYGRLYQRRFALIARGEKRLIVRINDVGPLRTGRVLDLNERSMRYFDPFLSRGLLDDASITLLPGEDWTAGPVGDTYLIDFSTAERRSPSQVPVQDAAAELELVRDQFDHPLKPDRKNLRVDASAIGGR